MSNESISKRHIKKLLKNNGLRRLIIKYLFYNQKISTDVLWVDIFGQTTLSTEEITMSLLDNFEIVTVTPKSASKSRSWGEIVDDTIDEQIRIANGEKIRNTKRNKKTGEYGLKQSWLKDGLCKPKIWIKHVLGDAKKGIKMDENQFKGFLGDMKGWRDDSKIKPLIDDIEKQYNDGMAKMRKTK